MQASELAKYIDHTSLKSDVTEHDIRHLCREALQYNFYGVCVNSHWIPLVAKLLENSKTVPVAVVGFPLGAMETSCKAFETRIARKDGAKEIDMVLNIGELKSKNFEFVVKDIKAVVDACEGIPLKVILETHLLTDEQKIAACKLCVEAGASFVKTSTGFTGGGAVEADIKLMQKAVGKKLGVKASGGVKTYDQTVKMIEAGATRIGTSSGVSIVTGQAGTGSY